MLLNQQANLLQGNSKAKSGISRGFSAVQEKVGDGVEAVKDAASNEKARVR